MNLSDDLVQKSLALPTLYVNRFTVTFGKDDAVRIAFFEAANGKNDQPRCNVVMTAANATALVELLSQAVK